MAIVNPPPFASPDVLNPYLDALTQEAISGRSNIDKDWDKFVSFTRGQQLEHRLPSYRVDFTMNMTKPTIVRKSGLLTDTKPIISVEPRRDDLSDAAAVLTNIIRAFWDERSILDRLTWMIYVAQHFGACPVNLPYDPTLDYGRGDFDFCPWDTRHFLMDPRIVRGVDLQKAEYVVFEQVKTKAELVYHYGNVAQGIKPDPRYSRYSSFATDKRDGSKLAKFGRYLRGVVTNSSDWDKESAIPTAVVQEFWMKDWRRFGELDKKVLERVNKEIEENAGKLGREPHLRTPDDLVFPGGRHIIRSGDIILLDEENPYFDNQFPSELLTWGMEIEHPWGASEVQEIKKLQEILNRVGAAVVENALLMSNAIWVADWNAFSNPKDWDDLTNRTGQIIKKKPGSDVHREAPPPLPASVFALMNMIQTFVGDVVTGMGNVMLGRSPGGDGSAQAIESLQLISQTVLRLQARSLETFLRQVGQKMIARICQFVTTDRIFRMLGEDEKIVRFEFVRDEFIQKLHGNRIEDVWRDFIFDIQPLSSLAITKMQKLSLESNLYSMGISPATDVAEAAGKIDPEKTVEEARIERMLQLAPQPVGMKQEIGGKQPGVTMG